MNFLRIYVPIVLFTLLASYQLISGPLVWGDYNLVAPESKQISHDSFLYIWSSDSLGTSPRMSFASILPFLLTKVPGISEQIIYLVLRVLPIFLIPIITFLIIRAQTKNKLVAYIAALFSIANPVVFADILNAQTLWIYPIVLASFYFAIRIFFENQFTYRNSTIFGILIFLALGFLPPIIIPLCIVLAFFVSMALPEIVRRKNLKNFFIHSAFIVALAGLMVTPFLIAAPSGQQAYSAPSTLADYYHNYSKAQLVNLSRLAGNAGGGQETLGYNMPSLTNSMGYLLLAIIGLSFLNTKKNKTVDVFKIVRVAIFATLLIIFGFVHLISTNVNIGEALFKSQWLVGTIRNPSKILVILLQLQIIGISLATVSILGKLSQRYRNYFLGLVTIVIIVYGWPVLRGDMGLFYEVEKENRKIGTVIPEMVSMSNELGGRSIIIPSSHEDELRYEKLSDSLNTFRLGGAYPATAELQKNLVASFNGGRSEFEDYMNLLGINYVYLKKDELFKNEPFSLFRVNINYDTAKEFLDRTLVVHDENSNFTVYKSGKPFEIVSLPRGVIILDPSTDSDVLATVKAIGDNAVVFSTSTILQGEKIAPCESGDRCMSVLRNPEIVSMTFVVDETQQQVGVWGKKTDGDKFEIASINKGENDILELNDTPLSLGTSTELLIRSGLQEVTRFRPESLTDEPVSFENGLNYVAGDASLGREGIGDVYATTTEDATHGYRSLLLGSKNHISYVNISLPDLVKEEEYLLSFDYKNITGLPLGYSIWQDNDDAPLRYATFKSSPYWEKAYIRLTPRISSKVTLYLYTDSYGVMSENLVDNINVEKIDELETTRIYVPSYERIVSSNRLEENRADTLNLLKNPSFEEGQEKYWQFGDASANRDGSPIISAQVSNDSVQGSKSLQLSSQNHTAYVSQRLEPFDPNFSYVVSLKYKNVSGRDPSFAIWQAGSNISRPTSELQSTSSDWIKFETVFTPESTTDAAYLYLYSDSREAENTTNLFDDIKITKALDFKSRIMIPRDIKTISDLNLNSSSKINPTLYQFQLSGTKGVIVFNQSYHKGWRAYVAQTKSAVSWFNQIKGFTEPGFVELSQHVLVNGYANGWYVDFVELCETRETFKDGCTINPDGSYNIELIIEFTPQRWFYLGLLISGTTLAGCLIFLAYDGTKRWRLRRQKYHLDLRVKK